MEWTSEEIRLLRHRLGWSQAEMARCLKLDLAVFASWEKGQSSPGDEQRNSLLMILHQAEMNAEKVQRRPIAEIVMRDRGLSQIHDFDLIEEFDGRIPRS